MGRVFHISALDDPMTGALLLLLWSAGCATIGFVLGAVGMYFVLKFMMVEP